MADNQASSLGDVGTEIDFTDPLGVKDPTGDDREDGGFGAVSILYQQKYNLVCARYSISWVWLWLAIAIAHATVHCTSRFHFQSTRSASHPGQWLGLGEGQGRVLC